MVPNTNPGPLWNFPKTPYFSNFNLEKNVIRQGQIHRPNMFLKWNRLRWIRFWGQIWLPSKSNDTDFIYVGHHKTGFLNEINPHVWLKPVDILVGIETLISFIVSDKKAYFGLNKKKKEN